MFYEKLLLIYLSFYIYLSRQGYIYTLAVSDREELMGEKETGGKKENKEEKGEKGGKREVKKEMVVKK